VQVLFKISRKGVFCRTHSCCWRDSKTLDPNERSEAYGCRAKASEDGRGRATLTFRQVFRGKHEPLEPLSGHNPFDDLGHIRHHDPAVKKVIGLDQDADAARALVKAARRANARLGLGEPARAELFFQRPVHLFRASSRA